MTISKARELLQRAKQDGFEAEILREDDAYLVRIDKETWYDYCSGLVGLFDLSLKKNLNASEETLRYVHNLIGLK